MCLNAEAGISGFSLFPLVPKPFCECWNLLSYKELGSEANIVSPTENSASKESDIIFLMSTSEKVWVHLNEK